MSSKIRLKNILIGVAISLAIFLLVILIFYFIHIFPLQQDVKMRQKEMKEMDRIFLEWQKEHGIQPSPLE